MQDLRSVELYVLLDMLVRYTTDYTAMYNVGIPNPEEFDKCKLVIKAIQKEIYCRRQDELDGNISEPGFILPGEN